MFPPESLMTPPPKNNTPTFILDFGLSSSFVQLVTPESERIQSGLPYLSSITLLLQKFLGNLQRYSMVKHHLIKPIQAMTIIFVNLKNIGYTFCMRVELYGRKEKTLGKYLSREKSDPIFLKFGPRMFSRDKAKETV